MTERLTERSLRGQISVHVGPRFRVLPTVMTREPMPRWLLAGVCIVALVMMAPFAPWVVLSIWLGIWAEQVHIPMIKVFGGRRGIAATVTVLLLVFFILPIGAMVGSLVIDAIALVRGLLTSEEGRSVLERLAQGTGDSTAETKEALTSTEGITGLVMAQCERAYLLLTQVAGVAAHFAIGVFILIMGIYGVLVDGRSWYAWFEQHSPLPSSTFKRLADTFMETGRGLAYGVVGAGLLQSIVATIAYIVLDVPQALALGMLTLLFSVIPAVGTAIVWAPVSAGLYLTGRESAGVTLAVLGVLVIGSIDNLARPWLARRGHLALPTFVVLLAMFGGIELLGTWGLLMGPLIVRLAKEAVVIRSESTSQPVVP